MKDLCAFEFTSFKLTWIKYLDTTHADKLLTNSSNVEMGFTTKNEVPATLFFLPIGQKIRKCSLHTEAPHFRHANLVLFQCDEPQIWQSVLPSVVHGLTLIIADVKSRNKCALDGGPHCRRRHRVALVTARHFT